MGDTGSKTNKENDCKNEAVKLYQSWNGLKYGKQLEKV